MNFMEISKHIAYLLQFHECVIIPEFGGFISNYKPALIDPVSQVFNPPSKEVIFNTRINKNDGLLMNYLVEVEKIGYHQAQTALLNFVDQLYNELEKGAKVKLTDLGSFEYDRSGNVIFAADSKFDLIDAYGLSPVRYETLHQKEQIQVFKARPAVRALNNRKDVIRIAASITLLLTLSLFPLKNNKLKFQSTNLNPIQLLMNEQPVVNKPNAVPEIEKQQLSAESDNSFILVGGSFQHFDNANQLQRELNADGHRAEIIEQENGFFRVVVDSFDNKEKALLAMKSYRSKHPGSNVWVSIR